MHRQKVWYDNEQCCLLLLYEFCVKNIYCMIQRSKFQHFHSNIEANRLDSQHPNPLFLNILWVFKLQVYFLLSSHRFLVSTATACPPRGILPNIYIPTPVCVSAKCCDSEKEKEMCQFIFRILTLQNTYETTRIDKLIKSLHSNSKWGWIFCNQK